MNPKYKSPYLDAADSGERTGSRRGSGSNAETTVKAGKLEANHSASRKIERQWSSGGHSEVSTESDK